VENPSQVYLTRRGRRPGRVLPLEGVFPRSYFDSSLRIRVEEDGDEGDSSDEPSGNQKGFKAMMASDSAIAFSAGSDGHQDGFIDIVVDSGATSHMVTSTRYMSEVQYSESTVKVAGGRFLKAIGTGKLECHATDQDGDPWPIVLVDVLIVPDLGVNLLSAVRLMDHGVKVTVERHYPHLHFGKKKSYFLQRRDELLYWRLKPINKTSEDASAYMSSTVEADLLHRRLQATGVWPQFEERRV